MKSIWKPYENHLKSIPKTIWNSYETPSSGCFKPASPLVKSIHFQVPSPHVSSRQEIVPKTSPAELVLWASYPQVPRRFVFPWDSHGNIGCLRLVPTHGCQFSIFSHWHDNLRHLWCFKLGFPEDFGYLLRAGWLMEGKFRRTGIGGGPSTLGSFPRGTW